MRCTSRIRFDEATGGRSRLVHPRRHHRGEVRAGQARALARPLPRHAGLDRRRHPRRRPEGDDRRLQPQVRRDVEHPGVGALPRASTTRRSPTCSTSSSTRSAFVGKVRDLYDEPRRGELRRHRVQGRAPLRALLQAAEDLARGGRPRVELPRRDASASGRRRRCASRSASFRETLENVHLVALALDASGSVTFCNDYLLELTGWSRSELIGRPWFPLALAHEEGTERLFVAALQEGTVPSHYEQAITTKSGELRLISWNVTTLRDARRRGRRGSSRSARTSPRRARPRRSLRASEERFRSLIENASDVITILDGNGDRALREPGDRAGARLRARASSSGRPCASSSIPRTCRRPARGLPALRRGGGEVVEVRVLADVRRVADARGGREAPRRRARTGARSS